MEIYEVYSVLLLTLFVVVVISNGFRIISRFEKKHRWMDRHLTIPRIFDNQYIQTPTRLQTLCHLLHLSTVVLYNCLHVTNLEQLASRAGQLCILHMVPLLSANHLEFISQILGLSRNTIFGCHMTIGLMALAQGVLHSVINLVKGQYSSDKAGFDISVGTVQLVND